MFGNHSRDGSTKTGNGYWCSRFIGFEYDGLEIAPLYNWLSSQYSPAHKSENKKITKCIEDVAKHLDG